MFDSMYNKIESQYLQIEGYTGSSSTVAKAMNSAMGNAGTAIEAIDATFGSKLENFNVNNYYSIRFNNTAEVPASVERFNKFEPDQYKNSVDIFNSDPRHMEKLISVIAFAYADQVMENIITKKRRLASEGEYADPITRNNEPNTDNVQSKSIFNTYGDKGYGIYMTAVRRLVDGGISMDESGNISTNDAVFSNIVKDDKHIPYVWLDTNGDYYLLKPFEAVTAMRNAFKSAVSSPNPQGVTIHELIDGKFGVKVVTPEKGAFINKIKDPTSNKKFDFKSQNATALSEFHNDILKIFGVTQSGNTSDAVIMYTTQERFDKIVKSDPLRAAGQMVANRLKSAKGHLI